MKIDLKRDCLLIIPENDQDRAYIEDTLGLHTNSDYISAKRVDDVSLGFQKNDLFVIRINPSTTTTKEGAAT
jgi:hypothetical protein